MKHLIICLLPAALLLGVVLPVRADNDPGASPNVSFGFAGSYGWYNTWERTQGDARMKYDFNPGYGGGIVFEKMFNNTLGIHSGLWFNQMNLIMMMKQSITSLSIDPMSLFYTKMEISGWTISFPLSLITSLNASFFSFQILTGIKYTHIVVSEMKTNNPLLYKKKIDLLPLLNQPQFGFTLGFFFKFRVARFVDLFFGGEGELYVTQLVKENNNVAHLFNVTAQAGVMFRTNVFPMPAPAAQTAL